jgi:hypothetical protein
MLEAGQRVAKPAALFGVIPEKVEAVSTPRPMRNIVGELQAQYGMATPTPSAAPIPSAQPTPAMPAPAATLPPPVAAPAAKSVMQQAGEQKVQFITDKGTVVSIPVSKVEEAKMRGWKQVQ